MSLSTLLFTAFDAAYLPLATITVPRMGDYAKRHGYQFHCYTEPIFDIPNAMYWSGVLGAAPNLETFDRVMYLDVDQLITNPKPSIEDLIDYYSKGFHASRDWGNDATEPWHFSMCGWVAHKDCLPMLHEAYELEPLWRDKPFPEQNVMQDIIKRKTEHLLMVDKQPGEQQWNGFINIHPRRTFNAVPDAVSPGNIPEPWDASCFAAHITMCPIDRRVEIAKEILNEKAKPMG